MTAWPQELRLSPDKALLTVTFEDGATVRLPAEYLRVMSPSAEVQGHSAGERKTVGGKRHVTLAAVDPVGNYAVRLTFSDGHNTGLFTWHYLADLGATYDARWAGYVADLAAKGLTRDQPGQR